MTSPYDGDAGRPDPTRRRGGASPGNRRPADAPLPPHLDPRRGSGSRTRGTAGPSRRPGAAGGSSGAGGRSRPGGPSGPGGPGGSGGPGGTGSGPGGRPSGRRRKLKWLGVGTG